MKHFLGLLALLFLSLPAVRPAAAQTQINRRYTETSLGPFPADVHESAVLSPDGRHLAYVDSGAGQRVVLDGKPQPVYDRVTALEFSRDGSRLAYAAQREGRWCIVSSGRESPGYERVGPPQFSPDGSQLAYIALLDVGKRAVVLDGRSGRPCDVVSAGLIQFSSSGARMAYGAVREGKCYLVVDGEELGPFDDLGTRTGYCFSAGGERLAFAALVEGRVRVVVDGKQRPPCYDVGDLVFSPNGQRVAYTAQEQKGGPWVVFVDDQKQQPFDTIGDGTLQFSPDSARLVYAAEQKGRWLAVVDGRPGEAHDGVAQMLFSPDSKRLACVVRDGQSEAVVVDGQAERTFDAIGGGSLVFSPNSRSLGYIAQSGRARFVVIDGLRKARYTMVGYLNFSPDSRRHAYTALDTRGESPVAFTVVDDREAAHRYESIWNPPGEKLLFDYRDRFHYIAVKKGEAFLVEERTE